MCTLQKMGGEDSKGRRVLLMPETSLKQVMELNLNGNYPYYPNYRLFFRETPPPLFVYSMRVYNMGIDSH